jgi:hypothetical protein
MFSKKLFCDITIHLVPINFQSCIPYSVTSCIFFNPVAPQSFWTLAASHIGGILNYFRHMGGLHG